MRGSNGPNGFSATVMANSSSSTATMRELNLPLLQEERRRSLEAERLLSTRFPKLELRLRKERQLLFRQWRSFVIAAIILIYFALILFRNLAYYRFRPGPPLKDLGHDLLPEMSDSIYHVDVPMYFMFGLIGFVSIGSIVGHDNPKMHAEDKPYFVNALRRVMIIFSVGHLLRAATYLSTSLPGTAKQCRKGSEDLDPPKNLIECFTRLVSVNGNCGDLNFSGHVLLLVMCLLFIRQYGYQMWQYPKDGWIDISISAFAIGLIICQILLILATRHHYTVDVVVALYVTPMLWNSFDRRFKDLVPDPGAIELELAREATWPKWVRILHAIFSLLLFALLILILACAFKGNFKWITGD